jgi:dihydroorotate dehydrogenase (NAD+) catalytic subunit
VLPIALRCVWDVYESVKIPLVGMGGVSTPADVIEMMLAGATAVEVGAANLRDPFACRNIVRDLPETMEKYGIDDLSSIIGGAH